MALAEELLGQLAFLKRLAYTCPIDYFATPFYILFATCRQPIEIMAHESQLNFKKLDSLDEISKLSDGISVHEISSFLYDDITSDDCHAQLSRVINYPFRLQPIQMPDGTTAPEADSFFVLDGKICLDFAEKYF